MLSFVVLTALCEKTKLIKLNSVCDVLSMWRIHRIRTNNEHVYTEVNSLSVYAAYVRASQPNKLTKWLITNKYVEHFVVQCYNNIIAKSFKLYINTCCRNIHNSKNSNITSLKCIQRTKTNNNPLSMKNTDTGRTKQIDYTCSTINFSSHSQKRVA